MVATGGERRLPNSCQVAASLLCFASRPLQSFIPTLVHLACDWLVRTLPHLSRPQSLPLFTTSRLCLLSLGSHVRRSRLEARGRSRSQGVCCPCALVSAALTLVASLISSTRESSPTTAVACAPSESEISTAAAAYRHSPQDSRTVHSTRPLYDLHRRLTRHPDIYGSISPYSYHFLSTSPTSSRP